MNNVADLEVKDRMSPLQLAIVVTLVVMGIHGHTLLAGAGADQLDSLPDDLTQIADGALHNGRTSEIEKTLHRLLQALDLAVDDLKIDGGQRPGIAWPMGCLDQQLDRRQRIADLVSDGGRETSEQGQLLRLVQSFLKLAIVPQPSDHLVEGLG